MPRDNRMNKLNEIQKREIPNDVFITPSDIAKTAISMVPNRPEYVWYDPWANSNRYYDNFPSGNEKRRTEILEGTDFFEFNEKVDVICSNPPFSKFEKIYEKLIELKPKVINMVIGVLNLTPRRIDIMKNAGYGLTKIHLFRVRGWFSNSMIIQFELGKEGIITFDRYEFKGE